MPARPKVLAHHPLKWRNATGILLPSIKTSLTNEIQLSYFTSAPFWSIVEGERFYYHPGLIFKSSKRLAYLIEDPHRSGKERDPYLCPEDTNAATFDRFLEWAYRGYYTQPSPTTDSKVGREVEGKTAHTLRATISNNKGPDMPVIEDELSESPAIPQMDLSGYAAKKKSKKGTVLQSPEPVPSQRDKLKKAFCSLQLPVPSTPNDETSARKNLNAGEDYTKIFLCHAELYVFAVQEEIEGLRRLALHKLHAVLAVFTLYQERTGDIIALLGYSYAKTKSPELGKEPLRELLASYVAFEMDTLMLDERFEDLMRDGSDMLSDYMSSVLKRIKS